MKKMHNLIIVDESGSMMSIEKQAVSGMLETLQSIKMSQKNTQDIVQTVTLITFNSNHLNFIYNCTLPEAVDPLSIKYIAPDSTGIISMALMSLTAASESQMKVGIEPRRSSIVCIFIPPLPSLYFAHGQSCRQSFIVLLSKAKTIPSTSSLEGSLRYRCLACAISI